MSRHAKLWAWWHRRTGREMLMREMIRRTNLISRRIRTKILTGG